MSHAWQCHPRWDRLLWSDLTKPGQLEKTTHSRHYEKAKNGASKNPATQAAAPPPNLALMWANPSPPGEPQEQIPLDNPQAQVEIKPKLKPRGSVAKKED